jgi:hypothetical protein
MSNVIRLSDYKDDGWEEVYTTDGPNSTLQVYVNRKTGETEVVQQNDDNETIRTPLSFEDAVMLLSAVSLALEKGRMAK